MMSISMNPTQFHNMIGHCGKDLMEVMIKTMGINLLGKFDKCMN